MSKAMIVIEDESATSSVSLSCTTDEVYNPLSPAHAIANYIALHMEEISKATKEAREQGTLTQPAQHQHDPLLGAPDQG